MSVHTKLNAKNNVEIIVNELNVRSVDRTRKDIGTWRQAQIAAEAVYYPNRCRLYDLYEDVLLDGHLSGIITKRIDAVLNKTIFFEKAGKKLPIFSTLVEEMHFRIIVRTIMETLLWGISGIEFLPGNELSYKLIPRKHIKPNLGIIAYEQGGTDGISYKELPNVWVMGDDNDLGLLLKCAPYYLYKRGTLSDWAEYIELFGQPIRIIKYDNYDEQTKLELRKILDESGSSLALMIPKQADFEIKDGKHTYGDGNLQLHFIQAMNDEMSVIILGNTLTSANSSSHGSYAQAKVHQEEQHGIMRSDLVYVTNMLNSPQFLSILKGYGYPVDGGRFVFSKDIDLPMLKDRIAIDKEVAAIVPVSNDYWYQTYGIPKPVNQ